MALHPYSYNLGSESDERSQVAFKLALLSAFGTLLTYIFFQLAISPKIDGKPYGPLVGYVITSPSVLGFFWFLYRMTSGKWWRKWFGRMICGVTVPDINGTWKGESVTYYPNHDRQQRKVRLVVWQDMRHIGICIDTPLHKIDSAGASIRRVADGWVVSFHYLALRKLKRQDDLLPPDGLPENHCTQERGAGQHEFNRDFLGHHSHVGCARLYVPDPQRWEVGEDCNFIKVQFYTDNRRIGYMELKRVATPEFPIPSPLLEK